MSTLIREAVEARDSIRRLIGSQEWRCEGFEWRELPPAAGRAVPHSVEDGGSNISRLRTYSLVTARAWAASFTGEGEAGGRTYESSFVGLVLPQGYKAMPRLQVYREVLEAHVARQAAVGGGLALYDGSPPLKWGRVGRKLTWEGVLEALAMLIKAAGARASPLTEVACVSPDPECAVEAVANARVRPFVPRLLLSLPGPDAIEEVSRKLGPAPPAERYEWLVGAENFERLYVYKLSIEEAWRRGSVPVFLVKTSRSTSFCHEQLPDVHVIEAILRSRRLFSEGYAVAGLYNDIYEYFGLSSKGGKATLYPSLGGVSDFYENKVSVLSMYVRLRPGGYVFRVDAVLEREMAAGSRPEGLAADVLSRLRSVPLSDTGYPIPLIIADSRARVTRDELERVLKVIGVDLTPESRSVLRV